MPIEESAGDSRERATIGVASIVLYCILAWVAWPSLTYQRVGLGDEAWIDTLRTSSLPSALLHVDTWWRPGESALFWLIAHSSSLVPWRMGMLALLLLTTLYLQLDSTVRARSSLDGFGAALTFSVNPSTLSVLCWLSAANVSVSAACILAYVAFSRRALEMRETAERDALLATVALALALSFYELSLFAPLVILAYHWLFEARPSRVVKRALYGGSLACVALYLGTQALLAGIPRFWAHASALDTLANSQRHVSENFYLWFNPFQTFGVMIPEELGDHTQANLIGWGLTFFGMGLAWYNRKRDPLTAFAGMWFLIFMAPIGTVLHVNEPLGEQYLYIPMLGMALGAIRVLTRFLEWAIASIRVKPLRMLFEGMLSLVLLWSLAPVVAECRRTVEHWSDSRALYLTSLQNYPTSQGSLAGLTQALSGRSPQLTAAEPRPSPTWKRYVDAFLLCPQPVPAAKLLAEGRAELNEQHYDAASSALARALATSSTPQEQLDSGKDLIQALSHTALRDRTPALLERLRHDHPAHADELAALR